MTDTPFTPGTAPRPAEPATPIERPLRPSRLARRTLVAVLAIAAVIALLAAVADSISVGYYAVTPGDAQPVAPLITVPSNHSGNLRGKVLLTDVYVTRLNLLTALPALLSSNTDVISSADLLGPATPPSQVNTQGYIEMAQSQQDAKAAALRRLGYQVGERKAGAMVFGTELGSPASGVLHVGQVVTAVNGTSVTDACSFVSAVHELAPGSVLHLTVEDSTVNSSAVLVPGKVVHETLRLGSAQPGATAPSCPGVTGPPRSTVGVQIVDDTEFTYPVKVGIDTTRIGGPSAGLAMTLGIVDALSGGDLTGGHVVAATGTIDPSGNVGDVGGVPQKTIAVERAGATVFLVPPQEYRAALSKADPSLRVVAVSTLSQALSVLAAMGGHVPAVPPAGS